MNGWYLLETMPKLNGSVSILSATAEDNRNLLQKFSDWVVNKQVEGLTGHNPQINSNDTFGSMQEGYGKWMFQQIGHGLNEFFMYVYHAIDGHIPEIGAIGTLIAGASIMIMGPRKALVYYMFFLGGCTIWQLVN